MVELLKAKHTFKGERYFLWAENDAISKSTKLTIDQVRRWLGHAKKFGLTLHFRGRNAFRRWLENEGGPDYGLNVNDARLTSRRTRVIVIVELLPTRVRPPGLIGPLGLPETPVEPSSFCPEMRDVTAPTCAMSLRTGARSLLKENGMENETGPDRTGPVFSHPLPEGTAEPTGNAATIAPRPSSPSRPTTRSTPVDDHADRWARIPADEQERLVQAALIQYPNLAVLSPRFRQSVAIGIWESEHPEAAPAVETEPGDVQPAPANAPATPQTHSQGIPKRSATRTPRKRPASLQVLPGVFLVPPEPDSDEAELVELLRGLDNCPLPDRAAAVQGLAESLCDLLDDEGSEGVYAARLNDCLKGKLSIECVIAAFMHGLAPGKVPPGKRFSAFINRHRDDFPAHKTAAGPLAKDTPAAARIHGPQVNGEVIR